MKCVASYVRICVFVGVNIDGTGTVIYFPGQGPIELTCTTEGPAGGVTLWTVNGTTFTLNNLRNGDLAGHGTNGTNIVISVPVNNTEYICEIATNVNDIVGDPVFIYIAGTV